MADCESGNERVLIMIKPHVFIDFEMYPKIQIVSTIMSTYMSLGLKVTHLKLVNNLDLPQIEKLYSVHRDKDFYNKDIIGRMIRGMSFVFILEGADAVRKSRQLSGATNPEEAENRSIRKLFGRNEKGPNNGVHNSDSAESFAREAKIFFPGLNF